MRSTSIKRETIFYIATAHSGGCRQYCFFFFFGWVRQVYFKNFHEGHERFFFVWTWKQLSSSIVLLGRMQANRTKTVPSTSNIIIMFEACILFFFFEERLTSLISLEKWKQSYKQSKLLTTQLQVWNFQKHRTWLPI